MNLSAGVLIDRLPFEARFQNACNQYLFNVIVLGFAVRG